jgi:deazaflavin-dependent oxidoreductase (nitroreductase family)
MSNETSAELSAQRRDWKTIHTEMYLKSGGAEGHIVDVRDIGGRRFTTCCLIRYVGRKSGRTIVTPLIYGDTGGEVVIVGSKGGADQHPAWYLNLIARPQIEFQIATQAFRGTWREPSGGERQEVWDFMCKLYPPYVAYQASTQRPIPLVMMTAVEEIPAFRE